MGVIFGVCSTNLEAPPFSDYAECRKTELTAVINNSEEWAGAVLGWGKSGGGV